MRTQLGCILFLITLLIAIMECDSYETQKVIYTNKKAMTLSKFLSSISEEGDDLVCPDGITTCNGTGTCCLLQSGTWGCCPYATAACCIDRDDCCPHGSMCCKGDGCCKAGEFCCPGGGCCDIDEDCCGDLCCGGSSQCCHGSTCCTGECCASGGCCDQGESCCSDGVCCPAGHSVCCGNEKCCPDRTVCCETGCCSTVTNSFMNAVRGRPRTT